ncbi:MAG: rhodanese-like domain-containing protein [Chloroflexi bacterium]|nr:rhodanese-like domain-containing protein [Chloroflexota bacterium]
MVNEGAHETVNILKNLFGSSSSNLTAAEAKARLEAGGAPYVLDVRQPEEFRAGHIAGATLIPLNMLGQSLSKLPQDREILCVCQSGARSSAAVRQLTGAGYQALNLSGGMGGWQRAGYPIKRGK